MIVFFAYTHPDRLWNPLFYPVDAGHPFAEVKMASA
jgi:hypothetical protein